MPQFYYWGTENKMILQSSSASFDFSHLLYASSSTCPCKLDTTARKSVNLSLFNCSTKRSRKRLNESFRRKWGFQACMIGVDGRGGNSNLNLTRRGAINYIVTKVSNELDIEELSKESGIQLDSNFTSFREDPIVDKLRTQLGVIHPIPLPPVNRSIAGLFVFFFFVGVVVDKLWTSRKKSRLNNEEEGRRGAWPQVPTSFSLFLEKDLQRKESVEWVNMVLGKLWKVYRSKLENWIIGLLQPVIDNLQKPDYVERVEIKQFSLGDEPLSVRNVERKTSRSVNDLQYQIGLRYTGDARMLLLLSLKFGIIPISVPVSVRDFDIDGELWVKLRLIPSEPWVGAASWAFVSLPKIKFELSPFRLFNLMAIPVLSMFLTKLLTEDLPLLFVRPKKIVLDFQKGKAVGLMQNYIKPGKIQEGNKEFVGELSVTLVDARKLSYVFYGKTDPYVILSMGDQRIQSKKNSQTTIIGRPGEPIWNQDFHMFVSNPMKQKLNIQVKDSLGFTDFTIGTGEVDLVSLQDTVPTDRVVVLQGGWGLFNKRSRGELLLRLTYKAYVEDEEDDKTIAESTDFDELSDSDEASTAYEQVEIDPINVTNKESLMDVLAALLVSEEFQGIVSYDTSNNTKPNSDVSSKYSTSPRTLNAESSPTDSSRVSEVLGGIGFLSQNYSCEMLPRLVLSSRSLVITVYLYGAGSALFWFAVITSVSVQIALNVGGSGFFNP